MLGEPEIISEPKYNRTNYIELLKLSLQLQLAIKRAGS